MPHTKGAANIMQIFKVVLLCRIKVLLSIKNFVKNMKVFLILQKHEFTFIFPFSQARGIFCIWTSAGIDFKKKKRGCRYGGAHNYQRQRKRSVSEET
jgi:hypothetical protein